MKYIFKRALLCTFLFISMSCVAQYNQKNKAGKLVGLWIRYLDENLNPVDSAHAVYYGFEHYLDGVPTFTFESNRWRTNYEVSANIPIPAIGLPVLLHGTFNWTSEAGHLIDTETYVRGRPLSIRSFSPNEDGVSCFSEVLDFTKHYKDQPHSWFFEELGCDDKVLKQYWMRAGKRGWRKYRIQ
ncbi:MAG: hypothetical protein JKY54_13795 [Flavobacteriales bacterium]|nr:hypothetical protein [Flavobacteriales bacterium]